MNTGTTTRPRDRAAIRFCATPCHRLAALLRAAFAVLVITAVAGCGPVQPTRVKVAGQVRLDGTPLEAGNIRFVPAHGRPASASIESEGHFQLTSATVGDPIREGVAPGEYKVAVSTVRIVDDETAIWIAPQKYANHLTSGIEVVIEQPTDSLIIDLFSEVEDVVDDEPVERDEQAESKDRSGLQQEQIEQVEPIAEHERKE